ncbi:heme ABC exporter ATP-binding protein CcmA [Jiella mangrovi]|uniref:Heme ABC exporter ATP-binding protein CcmA n=1 Tax=Jiella mangrovi TaxID=2821407 RepID=A0ABS4BKR1_9HYPH|nr:heme ABC exporter ATP-binding protein CcmA [Jiella mangrovi]MBP0617319.1 heme ABC exporter ATP-binding protein CcmA [Jiella mangrovi]
MAASVSHVALRGLVVGRGSVAAAGPFDTGVSAGEALVVTGPNGAGKSTLLRTLAGLLPPVTGAISLEGIDAADGEPAARLADAAHYVGHRHGMKGPVTVGDNLAFWARYLGGAAKARDRLATPAEALAAVGLPGLDAIPFSYLSAGQQRRASLARLLVAERKVWILDEPTSALDAASQERFAGLVETHLTAGGIVIAATHQPLGLKAAKTLHIAPRVGPEGAAGLNDKPAPAIDDTALAEAEGWL